VPSVVLWLLERTTRVVFVARGEDDKRRVVTLRSAGAAPTVSSTKVARARGAEG
jgi:siroheme synthase (precorrin-2 oxidase/ferrochelatase)